MIETPKEAARRFAAPVLAEGFEAVALHPYTDAAGEPIYFRARAKHPATGAKWIRPFHLNGSSYVIGEPQFPDGKPLYGLHRIAANPDAPIWVVEGEQKVDVLNKLGLVAATSGGATSATDADWRPLAGRTAIIWPDNDEPGQAYAGEVASRLLALGCKISCVEVERLGLGRGGDVVDWLETHKNANQSDVERLPRLTPSPGRDRASTAGVALIRGDSIKPVPVTWLWDGWLAAGKFHLVAGAPGTGKTTLALGLAATLTVGGRWPDGTGAVAGDVLIWSGEDSPADTLVPRLHACGADLSRVHFVGSTADAEGPRPFDPARDFPALAIEAARLPSLRMVVVDPVVSAVRGDSHKNAEVRSGLQPLVDFGEKVGAAILGVTHFSKGTSGRDPVERVTGSLAFAALARIVLATAKESEDNGGGRLLVRSKNNIGPDGGGFRYEIRQVDLAGDCAGIAASRPEWGESLSGEARELLALAEHDGDPEERSATDEAEDCLRSVLAMGRIEVKEARKQLKAEGFTEKQIRSARERLGVRRDRAGYGGRDYWALPLDGPRSCPQPAVAAVDALTAVSAHSYPNTNAGQERQERENEGKNGDDAEVL